LRQSGVFSSVALSEAEVPRVGGTLDMALAVVEAPLHRFGFGAEVTSQDGATLSAFWLHRNLWGGGERLRIEGEVAGIGTSSGDADYSASIRLDRPATYNADTTAFALAQLEQLSEVDYDALTFTVGVGLSRYFSPELSGTAAIELSASRVTDDSFTDNFRQLSLPVTFTLDRRDSVSDPKTGYWVDLGGTPFLGFAGTGSGVQLQADVRGYRAVGDRLVFAGRAQAGSVLGSDILETPREYLFHSGGGGTVRGQPYQSLGVEVMRDGDLVAMGGMSFAAISAELRADVTKTIGVVAFYDVGFVGLTGGFGGGDWHAGAGLGLRYATSIGPIRLDLAVPVSGDTGDGLQIYLGLGQAF